MHWRPASKRMTRKLGSNSREMRHAYTPQRNLLMDARNWHTHSTHEHTHTHSLENSFCGNVKWHPITPCDVSLKPNLHFTHIYFTSSQRQPVIAGHGIYFRLRKSIQKLFASAQRNMARWSPLKLVSCSYRVEESLTAMMAPAQRRTRSLRRYAATATSKP